MLYPIVSMSQRLELLRTMGSPTAALGCPKKKKKKIQDRQDIKIY